MFNDTDSNQIILERQIIARYRAMNSKDMEETEGGKKTTTGRTEGVLVEIWTRYLPNINQKRHRLSQLAQHIARKFN